jgi:pyrroloquinoline quinone biosynthesis protein D
MIRPQLTTGSRLIYDRVRAEHVLLVPEGIVRLNPTAAGVLELCDGSRSLDEIISILTTRYDAPDLHDDVRGFVGAMTDKGIVIDAGE